MSRLGRTGNLLLAISGVTLLTAWGPAPSAAGPSAGLITRGGVEIESTPGSAEADRVDRLSSVAPDLSIDVLELAIRAVDRAREQGVEPTHEILTVIDYSLPSADPRLWVLDLVEARLLFHERVAHGSGSGEALARSFSNRPGSHQSSLGLFLTGDTYVGRNGYSLRMHGLEEDINHRAFERAIVVHGAPYVSDAFAERHGRVGRSWGCPAVREEIAASLIDTIKGGSLIFAYYPDPGFLEDSDLLAP